MLTAVFCGPWPGVLTTALAATFAAVFLFEPSGDIAIVHPPDAIGLGVFLTMGLLICAMAGALQRIKERERSLIAQALRDSEDRYHLVVTGVKDYTIPGKA
jgi:K+-sensing histidine kinase KdpD